MKYYFLNFAGNLDDLDYCILENKPEGMGVYYSFMVKGIKASDHYPEPAIIRMSDDRNGLKVENLLGNTSSFLIVDKKVKEIIEKHSKNDIEYFSFDLLDHKGRVHSHDYFIINPIGSRNCLNYSMSEIEYLDGDINEVVGVDRFVLDPKKLQDQPVIFRIKEEVTEYVINEDLLKMFRDNKITNIYVEEIEQVEVEKK